MPIGSPAWHQSEEIGERLESLHVFRRMAGMADLDSIEPGRDQWLEALAASPVAGMRPDRDPSRFMYDSDCIFNKKAILGDERAPISAEVAHEGVAEVMHGTACDHRACNVWPSHRAAVRLLKHFVECERDSQ